ncbi:MAG: methyltransferase [Nitrososphaerota archaeon]|nr:methyltransferase [Candidatus Bathyarchaeota archaeon]MDW8024164.1 methyltransferase [Nitrososphaerota archaeon]
MSKKPSKSEHYFVSQPSSRPRFGIISTYLCGKPFKFITASSVFSKKRIDLGTRLLIESMVLPEKGLVLDVGCGYGAIGIAAAVFNPNLHVVMVDVNERAVRLAKQNIKINGVRNAEVRRGPLYKPVEGMVFHCILSNPPVSAGLTTVKALITEAPKYMTEKATFQMVVRSKIGGKRLKLIFEEAFGNCAVLARKSGYRVLIASSKKSPPFVESNA